MSVIALHLNSTCPDERLNPFQVQWKTMQGGVESKQGDGNVKFTAEGVEWVKISR